MRSNRKTQRTCQPGGTLREGHKRFCLAQASSHAPVGYRCIKENPVRAGSMTLGSTRSSSEPEAAGMHTQHLCDAEWRAVPVLSRYG